MYIRMYVHMYIHMYVCIICIEHSAVHSIHWLRVWLHQTLHKMTCPLQWVYKMLLTTQFMYVTRHTVHFRQCYKCTTPCKNGVTYPFQCTYCTCNYSMWNMGIRTYMYVHRYMCRLTENTPYIRTCILWVPWNMTAQSVNVWAHQQWLTHEPTVRSITAVQSVGNRDICRYCCTSSEETLRAPCNTSMLCKCIKLSKVWHS